jgi:hypothetical protein
MPLLRRRAIVSDEPGPGRQAIAKKDEDTFLTAILTWIPVEVIVVYKFVMGIIPTGFSSWRLWLTVIVIVLTPVWIAFATKPENRKIAWRQVILSPFAFVCWVAALQEDVVTVLISGWQPWMGSVVLGIGTLVLPTLDGILRKLGFTQN